MPKTQNPLVADLDHLDSKITAARCAVDTEEATPDSVRNAVYEIPFAPRPEDQAWRLPHRERLLSDIVEGVKSLMVENALLSLQRRPEIKLVHLNVFFQIKDGLDPVVNVWSGSLTDALDVISNDLFFDDTHGDWSAANCAEVTYG